MRLNQVLIYTDVEPAELGEIMMIMGMSSPVVCAFWMSL